ncbi:MAG: polyphosphate kinase 1 [Verrucomicrobiia bacterium]
MTTPDPLNAPELFSNRDLSWLEFNQRVLEEARDPLNPLLERVKFLAITCSNLDEFFEIRVAGIKQQIENDSSIIGPDGLRPAELFARIRARVERFVHDQYHTWNAELLPELAQHHIRFHHVSDLSDQERVWAHNFFLDEVFPVLTPLAIDPSHPFPQLLNKSLNLIVALQRSQAEAEPRYAIVQVPRVLNRLIFIPDRPPRHYDIIHLSRLIEAFIGDLFPGMTVLGVYAFRVTRNSDLYVDEEEAENLLQTIEEELKKRNRGNAVRLEIDDACPQTVKTFLLDKFGLTDDDCYQAEGTINLLRLLPLTTLDTDPALKDKPFSPVPSPMIPPEADLFELLRRQDILLHHPYETFSTVIELLQIAADDPHVLAIKMTLYRTSGDSPLVKALIDASNRGKQISVLVELRARFDEENNIAWARRMEEAGIHVVYGLVGLKTHCKTLLIVRRDEDQIRHYAHLGTGNYHPRTARLYTDLGLLTTRPELTKEVAMLFNILTGMADYPGFHKLLVAPFDLADAIIRLIRAEVDNAKLGLPARIFFKMNSLVDPTIIRELYLASQAGVRIDLCVRGICCLRPGIPGISDRIEVRSIVGRFLEHSRIFYFENAGHPKVYVGSADLMPRNLYKRVEVVFPIEDPTLRSTLTDFIIDLHLRDNVKARRLLPDGTHERIPIPEGTEPIDSQALFMARAGESFTPPSTRAKKAVLQGNAPATVAPPT